MALGLIPSERAGSHAGLEYLRLSLELQAEPELEISRIFPESTLPRAEREETIVARDIRLAELTGCRLHVQHVPTAGSVELVRDAKKRGVPVTCEVTPHHLFLTQSQPQNSQNLGNPRGGGRREVRPPLASQADVGEP